VQRAVLKDEKPFTDRPNDHLTPIDFDKEWAEFEKEHPYAQFTDLLSSLLYPKVFADYWQFRKEHGDVSRISTPVFFFGLKEGEETTIEIARGKSIIVRLQSIGPVNEEGMRTVFFTLNGQTRNLEVRDEHVEVKTVHNAKADRANAKQIGAPLQGMLSKVLVEAGQQVAKNTPLFVIEAMKMETTITAPDDLTVSNLALAAGTRVQADDLVLTVQ
jgi:pyruvate carboxylase